MVPTELTHPWKPRKRSWAAAAILILGAEIVQAQPIRLALNSAAAIAGSSTTLNLDVNGSGSAALQFTLSYSPSDFSNIQFSPGPAATAAGKSLVCAGRPGIRTCVLSGMNARPIGNGTVAVATLQTTPGAAARQSRVLLTSSVAASPGASGIATSSSLSNGLVTINPGSALTLAGLSCTTASLVSGASTVCAVTLSGAAPDQGSRIALASSNAALVIPASVSVAPRATSAQFTVSSAPNLTDQTATLSAALAGTSRATTVSLVGIKPIGISCAGATVKIGRYTQCSVTLNSSIAPSAFAMPLQSSTPYLRPSLASFSPGQTAVLFSVSASGARSVVAGTISTTFNGTTAAVTVIAVP